MRLGYIGLGKMGASMVELLLEKGHKVVAYDADPKAAKKIKGPGVIASGSLEDLAHSLKGKNRLFWIMVPHRFVDDVLKTLEPFLKKGDTIIDGGNSPYRDSMKRAKHFKKFGVHYLDAGVSGGPKGARNGSCVMVGGSRPVFKKFEKLFRDISVEDGYAYMGPSGSGHYVKMVHNGIEYGMMQAMAEGFDVMYGSREFDLDLRKVSELYRHGSVISSSLMGWMSDGYRKFGTDLKKVPGSARASGEGLWTIEAAKRDKRTVKVIEESLKARKRSQKKANYQGKVIQTLRNMFGGHPLGK